MTDNIAASDRVIKASLDSAIRSMEKETRFEFSRQKTLEVNLLPGEELQALAKEVIVQPPDIIHQIRRLIGE